MKIGCYLLIVAGLFLGSEYPVFAMGSFGKWVQTIDQVEEVLPRDLAELVGSYLPIYEYSGSEAEALVNNYRIRTSEANQGRHLQEVQIGGQRIDLLSHNPPWLEGYRIVDQELADQAGVPLNTVLTQDQITRNPAAGELLLGFEDGHILALEGIRNPLYRTRDLAQVDRESIQEIINEVNATPPEALEAGFVPNGCLNIREPYSKSRVDQLMFAIESGDRDQLVRALVQIRTIFNGNGNVITGANFIEAFATLFVTKNFPSRGLAIYYLQAFLRSGEIYLEHPTRAIPN